MGLMGVGLNGEPLEEVNCFKYPWSQCVANGGCKKGCVTKRGEPVVC